MYKLTTLLTFVCLLLFSNLNAQDPVPDILFGKWKIYDVFAVDEQGVVDDSETASLMNDLVDSNTVEYEFAATTFTLYVNGTLTGSCGMLYDDLTGDFTFDQDGIAFEEIVHGLVGITATETELEVEAASPDVDSGIKFKQFLIKQE